MESTEIRLIGEVSILANGDPVVVGSLQARIVLAVLVLERGRAVPRSDLIRAIWGLEPPASAESVLRTAVAKVRAALDDAGLGRGSVLRASMSGYQIGLPADAVVDIEEAESLCRRASDTLAGGAPNAAVECAERAVTILGQPFLAESASEWTQARRGRLRDLLVRAQELLARAWLRTGRANEAVSAAEQVVDLDPFRESAYRTLMAAYESVGNRARALMTYEACRRLLADELGVDPSTQTQDLYLALLKDPLPFAAPPVTAPAVPAGSQERSMPPRLGMEGGGLLVGRRPELDTLRTKAAAAGKGEGSMVLVEGEAGMGKTALIAHAARDVARRGAVVVYGRCDEDVTLAYRPIAECLVQLIDVLPDDVLAHHVEVYGGGLLRLVPELRDRIPGRLSDAGGDPDVERHLLFRSVARLVARAAFVVPVVFVIDDLHWADMPTMQLLRYLAAEIDRCWVCLIVAFRGPETAEIESVSETVQRLARHPGSVLLRLGALTDDDLVPLVEAAAGRPLGDLAGAWARMVGRESQGNPFFARELLHHVAEQSADRADSVVSWALTDPVESYGLPESIREVILRRVARLGPSSRHLLVLASVAGQDFDVPTLAQLAATDEDAVLDELDRAVVAGLLVEVPDSTERYGFRHALVQNALYGQLGSARRRRIHRGVALALEAQPDRSERLGEIAHHWLNGFRPDELARAVESAYLAGMQALRDLAPDQALRWFTSAFAHEPCLADREDLSIDVLIGLGEAQRCLGDQGFRATLLTAGRRARTAGDAVRLVRAALASNRGSVSSIAGVDTERVDLIESAIAAIGSNPHPSLPHLQATLAIELLGPGLSDRRRLLSDVALKGARGQGDPALLARVLALRFEAVWEPATADERLAETGELVELARGSEDRQLRFFAHRMRSFALWEHGRHDESDEHLNAECRLADQIGQPYLRWIAAVSRAGRSIAASRLDEAEDLAQRALMIGTEAGESDAVLVHGVQAMRIRRQQGRSQELLEVIQGLAPGMDIDARPAIAALLCDSGAPAEAGAVAAELLEQPVSAPATTIETATWWTMAEVAAAVGHGDAARRLYAAMRGLGRFFIIDQACPGGPFDHHLGLLAATFGDLDVARWHFAAAVGALARSNMPYWLAEAQVGWAEVLLRSSPADDRALAHVLLERADDSARRFGFAGTRRRISALGTRVSV